MVAASSLSPRERPLETEKDIDPDRGDDIGVAPEEEDTGIEEGIEIEVLLPAKANATTVANTAIGHVTAETATGATDATDAVGLDICGVTARAPCREACPDT